MWGADAASPECPGNRPGGAALAAAEGQADGPLGAGWPRLAGPAHCAASRLQEGSTLLYTGSSRLCAWCRFEKSEQL